MTLVCRCGSTSCGWSVTKTVETPFGKWKRAKTHDCWCARCNPGAWWMVTCALCGSKRCPKAMWHEQPCDGGQP